MNLRRDYSRSADLPSAVSRVFNLQARRTGERVENADGLPMANRRYGRLKICATSALTLLEMMVAITLLAVIMVGLVAMFNQTQKALHIVNAQTDVFENMRGAVETIARDLAEMTAFDDLNVINAYAVPVPSPIPGNGTLPLPTGVNMPVDFDEAFWLSRENDDWRAIGYFVEGTNFGVGTLYRFSGTARREVAPLLLTNGYWAPFPTNTYAVSDGIVHFVLHAVYPEIKNGQTNFISTNRFTFFSNALPAFVDLEVGILEPATLKQFHSLTGNVSAAQNFLRDHVGNIHFFRERVPIRNFINPYRSNEVP